MASSTVSGSLCPPSANNLMPLSGIGLCDAEIITPRSAPNSPTRYATAGVGSTPARSTSAPAEASPAVTAASSISPLARGSRPTTATGRCDRSLSASTRAADAAIAIPSSGVNSALARPRTPSVPNSRPIRGSALAVLGRLAGLLQAVLLTFGGPCVPGEEAGGLERRTVVRVQLDQRPGNAQAQRAGLAGDAAAVQGGQHVVVLHPLGDHQRLLDQLLVHLVREVGRQVLAVEPEAAGARHQPDPHDGFLAPTHGLHRAAGRSRRRGGRGLLRWRAHLRGLGLSLGLSLGLFDVGHFWALLGGAH